MTSEESDQEFIRKFEELKRDWNAIKPEPPKSQDEVRRMMYAAVLSRLTGFRVRSRKENLIFLGKLLVTVTLIVVFGLFDHLVTAIFGIWSLLIILDDYIGLRYLYFIKYQGPLVQSMQNILTRLKRLNFVSRLAHVFICGLIIVIALSTTTATNAMLTVILSLAGLTLFSWWTSRKWKDKIEEVNVMLNNMVDDSSERGTMAVKS